MHSRIFQISSKRIAKGDYANPEDFYDNSGDFADYIGYEIEGDERKADIGCLAEELSDLFALDESGEALIYKGGLDAFKQAWADAIHKTVEGITADNVLMTMVRYRLECICNETHLRSSFRVFIPEWNGYAATMSDLIGYIASERFKPGKKLYIGAVIDYHC